MAERARHRIVRIRADHILRPAVGLHPAALQQPVRPNLQLQARVQRRQLARVLDLDDQLVRIVRADHHRRMKHLHQELRRPLHLHRRGRAAAEGDRRILRQPRPPHRPAKVQLDAVHADLVAAQNELALLLPRRAAIPRQDIPKAHHPVRRQRVAQAPVRKRQLGHHILQREDPRRVHQQQPRAEKLLQRLDPPLDHDHTVNPRRRNRRRPRGRHRLEDNHFHIRRLRRAAPTARIVRERNGLVARRRFPNRRRDRHADRHPLATDRQHDVENRDIEILGILQLDHPLVDQLLNPLRRQRLHRHLRHHQRLQRQLRHVDHLLHPVGGGVRRRHRNRVHRVRVERQRHIKRPARVWHRLAQHPARTVHLHGHRRRNRRRHQPKHQSQPARRPPHPMLESHVHRTHKEIWMIVCPAGCPSCFSNGRFTKV